MEGGCRLEVFEWKAACKGTKTARIGGFGVWWTNEPMKKNNPLFVILGFLFSLNILAWIAVYDLSQPRFLEVTFFDVGQGDAIFIETPQRHQILIDGGPSSPISEKLTKEMPFWDRTIDLIVLTHP